MSMRLALGGPPGIFQTIPSVSGASPCDFTVKSDGTIESLAVSQGPWISPGSAAAYYEVKVDPTSGTFSSGATGTWLACTSNRSWFKSSGTVTFTISFREAATGVVRKTQAGVTLQGL